MKTIQLYENLQASQLVLGLMRINELTAPQLDRLLHSALDLGINLFDLADIYGSIYGECETLVGLSLKRNPGLRHKMLIQTKCAIVMESHGGTSRYDFSKGYLLKAVEGSLKCLGIEKIDILLLHRPDALMEPEEVAETFTLLQTAGKVDHFGVSNFNPSQMELLQSSVSQPLRINQLQFGPAHTGMLDYGLRANTTLPGSENRDGAILDYCRLKHITIQAWSPFLFGLDGTLIMDNPDFVALNKAFREIGNAHGISPNAVVSAWISRHPAGIQTMAGTTKPERLAEIAKGIETPLSREEWYKIYIAGGKKLP
ncbi:MAG: aldo/keto reductase [Anaerolineaceae bacterium]|nr:aldo/keto reductase [Anaerolineaceae bacterium]